MNEYKRNCLSGPATLEHWRRVHLNVRNMQWTTTLDIPGEQAFSLAVIRDIQEQFQTNPEASRMIVSYNEPFAFDPNEVTTGSQPLDIKLSALRPNVQIASMAFQPALGARVKLTRGPFAVAISTGWVQVHGVEGQDIFHPLPVPNITIESNGQITFQAPR